MTKVTKRNNYVFNNLFIKVSLCFLAFLYLIVSFSPELFSAEYYIGPSFRVVSFVSIIFYLFVLLLSVLSISNYFFLLPIVIAFIPNAINDLFPGMLMGPSEAFSIPSFSFFTHIDFFLFLGILRYCNFSRKNKLFGKIIAVFLPIALLYALMLIFENKFWVMLMGGCQIRYYFFAFLILAYSDAIYSIRSFFWGLAVSIFLVVFESLIFSLLNEVGGRLTSGNFGVNPLGHFAAACCAMLFFLRNSFKNRAFWFAGLTLLIIVCTATGTRFSLISLTSSIVFVSLIKARKFKKNILIIALFLLVLGPLFYFTPQGHSLAEGVLFTISQDLSDVDCLERTPESSSMITRILAWSGTLDMIGDNSRFGVGPAVWSFKKEQYNVPFEGLLDPHNDFLNYIVSYGIFLGTIFYILVFIYPLVCVVKNRKKIDSPYFFAAIAFLFSIFCSSLTNAVTYKHQLCILTYLISLFILGWLKKSLASYDNFCSR